ncbi:MAG TPA: mandelate racemase/muconate lactonizing enzyme family protein [Bradyrhizobium sp.]|nr:mandelate racemase/muconate lactonizing enzyme family protein [Bradyrhizobium sp.]
MHRREFLKALALAAPSSVVVPSLSRLAAQERRKVKITDVKVMRIRMKGHAMPLVKIETDAGVHGIGECHHDITGLGAKDAVLNAFREMLIGQDPFDIDKLTTQMMWRVSYLGGNHGIAVHGVTGCEVALWDLSGKLLAMPVRKILAGGAFTDKVRAYWTSQPRNMLDPASCREWADYIKGSVQKWTAAKCFRLSSRPGGSPLNRRMSNEELDKNVQGFMNIRDAVGPYFEIAVHCHWEYDFYDALRLAKGMEKLRPWWIEDPMPPNYVDTWVKLTAASPVPILTGENLYTRSDFLPFIVNQAVHIVEIDISQAGGLLEAKRIADLARTYNIPVATHNVMGPVATIASANCAAAIQDFLGHETFDFRNGNRAGEGDLIVYDREIIKDGYIQLSDKPGLGVEINKDFASRYLMDGETWWG